MVAHEINQEACKQCGLCVEICPSMVYHSGAGLVQVNPAYEPLCAVCGQCMAICPTQAVTVEGLNYADFPPLSRQPAAYEALLELMRARRTCRRFTDEPIPREVLDKVIEAAQTAPMAIPPSPVEVVVLNGREKVQEMVPEVVRQTEQLGKALKSRIGRMIVRRMVGRDMWASFYKFAMLFMEPMLAEYRKSGADMFSWHCHAVLFFHADRRGLSPQIDCDIACAYAMLAAESLGLGTGWNGMLQGTLDESKVWRERLGVPARNRIYAALTLGYPARQWERGAPWRFKSVRWP